MSHHEPTYLPHEREEPDPWHQHTPEEGLPQEEHAAHANTRALLGVFIFMVVFLVVSVAITIIYFNRHIVHLRQANLETTELAAQQLEYQSRSFNDLEQYAWEDPQEGIVRIPVSKAMEKVVQRYQQQGDMPGDG